MMNILSLQLILYCLYTEEFKVQFKARLFELEYWLVVEMVELELKDDSPPWAKGRWCAMDQPKSAQWNQ